MNALRDVTARTARAPARRCFAFCSSSQHSTTRQIHTTVRNDAHQSVSGMAQSGISAAAVSGSQRVALRGLKLFSAKIYPGQHHTSIIPATVRELSSSTSRWSSSLRYFSSDAEVAEVLTEEAIKDKVLRAVQKHLEDRVEDLNKEMEEAGADKEQKQKLIELMKKPIDESSTWQDLGFDEFDRVEVLLEVEEAFDHVIPDEVADTIMGVKEAVDYMVKKKKAAA